MKVLKKTLGKFRQSFQLRIFLALGLIIVIFIPGTAYIGYLQALKVAQTQVEQYTIGTGQQIAKHVNSFLSTHTSNVTLLASLFEKELVDTADTSTLVQFFTFFKKRPS